MSALVGLKLESLSKKLAGLDVQEEEDNLAEMLPSEDEEVDEAAETRLVTTVELREQMKALWAAEKQICELVWGSGDRFAHKAGSDRKLPNYDVFFITV